MDLQPIEITRTERRARNKKKSAIYYILIEQGFIVLLPFLFLSINDVVAAIFLGISVFLLPFLTKQKIIMLFCNLSLLGLTLTFLYLADIKNMKSDLNILLVIFVILAVLLIFLVQVFVIVIKIYNAEVEKPPNTDKAKWYIKFPVKMIYWINLIISKMSLLLPFLYYVLITFLLIYMYAILYSSLNYYYEIRDEKAGYYMSTESIMNNADDLGYSIYANYGDASENSDSMRIPIVDIRFDKKVQNSNDYTSKQKQDIILREFGQNTLKIALSEYMYFSSTTFFTVGYGDVALKGRVPKLVSQSEMFVAGFFHIIFIPLFLFIITDYLSKRRIRDKSKG